MGALYRDAMQCSQRFSLRFIIPIHPCFLLKLTVEIYMFFQTWKFPYEAVVCHKCASKQRLRSIQYYLSAQSSRNVKEMICWCAIHFIIRLSFFLSLSRKHEKRRWCSKEERTRAFFLLMFKNKSITCWFGPRTITRAGLQTRTQTWLISVIELCIFISVISMLFGVTTLYNTGLTFGWPISLVFGWLIARCFTMFAGLSMAKICSSYPISRGVEIRFID